MLSGYAESTDSSDLLYKYKAINSRDLRTYKILPSSTVLFETLSCGSGGIAGKPGQSAEASVINFADKIAPWTDEEITRAIIDIKEQSVDENTVVIYELKNRECIVRRF